MVYMQICPYIQLQTIQTSWYFHQELIFETREVFIIQQI